MDWTSMLQDSLMNMTKRPVIRSPQMEIAQPQYEDKIAEALIKLEQATGFGYDSPEARRLLRLTKAVESENGKYLRQLSGGPGRGPFQVEPKTERDIWENYLEFHPKTRAYVEGLKRNLDDELYGATMARIKYKRAPGKLPKDVGGMAKYWAKHYNTKAGSKRVQQAQKLYQKYYGQ